MVLLLRVLRVGVVLPETWITAGVAHGLPSGVVFPTTWQRSKIDLRVLMSNIQFRKIQATSLPSGIVCELTDS